MQIKEIGESVNYWHYHWLIQKSVEEMGVDEWRGKERRGKKTKGEERSENKREERKRKEKKKRVERRKQNENWEERETSHFKIDLLGAPRRNIK